MKPAIDRTTYLERLLESALSLPTDRAARPLLERALEEVRSMRPRQ